MSWLGRLMHLRSRQDTEGLVLGDGRWQIVGLTDPSRLFANLARLVPSGAYLFLEGGAHPADLRRWLEAHKADTSARPALGTIWPGEPFFSVGINPDVLAELAGWTESLAYPEVCCHLHVFTEDRLLISGYDAFSDPFFVSEALPEDSVREFCGAAGCRYQPS